MAVKPQNVPRETSVARSILRALNALPGCVAEKAWGGIFGRVGKSDIIGCYGGRCFFIEVKRPGEKPTPAQNGYLERWARAGALVGAAHSKEEALAILGLTQGLP